MVHVAALMAIENSIFLSYISLIRGWRWWNKSRLEKTVRICKRSHWRIEWRPGEKGKAPGNWRKLCTLRVLNQRSVLEVDKWL